MLELRKLLTPLLVSIFLFGNVSDMVAQSSGKLARANAAYEKLAFTPAIELYLDVLKADEDNFEALFTNL